MENDLAEELSKMDKAEIITLFVKFIDATNLHNDPFGYMKRKYAEADLEDKTITK